MNAKYLIAAAAALAVSGSVLAQEYVVPDAGFVSTKTRAEVNAELAQARSSGALDVTEYDYPVVRLASVPKTRAQVSAELAQARADGSLEVAEYEYPVLQASATTKTREQVREELAQHQRDNPNGETFRSYIGG